MVIANGSIVLIHPDKPLPSQAESNFGRDKAKFCAGAENERFCRLCVSSYEKLLISVFFASIFFHLVGKNLENVSKTCSEFSRK
jgi:hypothetical protein